MAKIKSWQPKKVREFSYSKKAAQTIDEWFLNYANLYEIQRKTGLARTTLYRWRKEMVKDNKSLQDFITVSDYKTCVELELADWKKYTEKKEKEEEINNSLSKQARDLRAQLAAQGYKVTIRATKAAKDAQREAKFKQILLLQSDKDPKKASQGQSLFNKLSDKDKQAYLKYRKSQDNG